MINSDSLWLHVWTAPNFAKKAEGYHQNMPSKQNIKLQVKFLTLTHSQQEIKVGFVPACDSGTHRCLQIHNELQNANLPESFIFQC